MNFINHTPIPLTITNHICQLYNKCISYFYVLYLADAMFVMRVIKMPKGDSYLKNESFHKETAIKSFESHQNTLVKNKLINKSFWEENEKLCDQSKIEFERLF